MAINYHKKKDAELKDKSTANPWQVSVYGLGFEKEEEVQLPRNTALVDGLTDEDIAKFLDGAADANLQMRVLKEARVNPMLADLLCQAAEIDKEMERVMKENNLADFAAKSLSSRKEAYRLWKTSSSNWQRKSTGSRREAQGLETWEIHLQQQV